MNGKFLIVNGDDFGISTEVNQAIILAHQRGVLTSCSLMPGGKAFDEAVSLARENPGLAVGIHVTCVAGRPVLTNGRIPNLVGPDGAFTGDPYRAGLTYFFCKSARKQLFDEIAAQFEKFFAAGLKCSHIDSHCHMHANPAVLDMLVEFGEKYGIRKMRVPDDDFFGAAGFSRNSVRKAPYAITFKALSSWMRVKLARRGFRFASGVYGNILTGEISREYVLSILDRVQPGISEMYLHPSLLPDTFPAGDKELQLFREFQILLDPEVRSKMERLGITPATYSDFDRF